jgi:predicted amidohydrolase YtcJ
MTRGRRLALAVAVTLGVADVSSAQIPPELVAYPELILLNGKVLTVDQNFTVAEAVAVRDGRILAVGSSAEMKRLVGSATRTIDLAGRSVVPGFIDSDGDNAFAGGDLYAAARFIHEEDVLGSVEKGKYADLVVLNGDYLGVADDELDELEPVMTIVGGRVAFEAGAPATRAVR